MNEIEESKYQNEQEYNDLIRLEVIYEQIANMHSRICREKFRTREESNEMLDIVQAVIKLQTHFKENYEKRKERD